MGFITSQYPGTHDTGLPVIKQSPQTLAKATAKTLLLSTRDVKVEAAKLAAVPPAEISLAMDEVAGRSFMHAGAARNKAVAAVAAQFNAAPSLLQVLEGTHLGSCKTTGGQGPHI